MKCAGHAEHGGDADAGGDQQRVPGDVTQGEMVFRRLRFDALAHLQPVYPTRTAAAVFFQLHGDFVVVAAWQVDQ
ncbi:hypothetical protein D3C76_999380 [compost metagenome]